MKHRARLLQKRAIENDAVALATLREQPELRPLADAVLIATLQRKHCLTALAKQLGFTHWPHARAVLSGEALATLEQKPDLGTLLHREQGGAYWNIWSASYEEASGIRAEHGGFLLPYKKQFLIVEPDYLAALGLDPSDPDWTAIGRNWPAPSDHAAWSRLTSRAIDARLDA